MLCKPGVVDISIHALREEGDRANNLALHITSNFNPRPPRGGRREEVAADLAPCTISIHALREEGDTAQQKRI